MTPTSSSPRCQAPSLSEGIEYAWAHGAIPVLASGNTNPGGLGLLGSSDYGSLDAIVVGATGPSDEIAPYSSPSATPSGR